jgi:hypothetical protein
VCPDTIPSHHSKSLLFVHTTNLNVLPYISERAHTDTLLDFLRISISTLPPETLDASPADHMPIDLTLISHRFDHAVHGLPGPIIRAHFRDGIPFFRSLLTLFCPSRT